MLPSHVNVYSTQFTNGPFRLNYRPAKIKDQAPAPLRISVDRHALGDEEAGLAESNDTVGRHELLGG